MLVGLCWGYDGVMPVGLCWLGYAGVMLGLCRLGYAAVMLAGLCWGYTMLVGLCWGYTGGMLAGLSGVIRGVCWQINYPLVNKLSPLKYHPPNTSSHCK